mgnify:CR=1 FL=1
MILAGMVAEDEDALICDLAETYQIYDYRSLPLQKVAVFCAGLRENSRIKMKLNRQPYSMETLLLASVSDYLSLLLWMNTKDGQKGINKPHAVLDQLLGKQVEDDTAGFDSPEDFEAMRKKILKGEV